MAAQNISGTISVNRRNTVLEGDFTGSVHYGIQGPPGPQGPKGDPFTYEDFTPQQLEDLKVKGDKGDPFTYADFTQEQLDALKGDPGYTPVKGVDYFDGKDGQDGKDGKDGVDGKNAYQYALDGGYTGTEEEFTQKLAAGGGDSVLGSDDKLKNSVLPDGYPWENRIPIVENVSCTAVKQYDIIANNVTPGTTYHIVLTVGETVTEYECVAYQVDYGWATATAIGNGRLVGDNVGEDVPFLFQKEFETFYTTIDGSFSVDRSDNGAFPFDNYHYFEGSEYTYVSDNDIIIEDTTPLVVGKTYCVTLNGIDYYCPAINYDGGVFLGTDDNVFEVFYFVWEEGPPSLEIYTYKAGENIFSIHEADLHKLDPKYLPDVPEKADLIIIGPTSFDDEEEVIHNTDYVGSLEKVFNKILAGELPSVYFRDNENMCFCLPISMEIYDDIFITFKFAHPRHGEFEYIMDMYEGEPHLYLFSKVDGLPAVTEEDDGSIMEVVNGKWEKVAVKDSSVATFVDDYISSALEGDY
jgi:hypothetical protein